MGAAAAPVRGAAARRAPVRPAHQERRLTVVAASRRRWRFRRARWGLVAGALMLVGIMWIGLLQLRLTTKIGVVERQTREVQAYTQTLKARLSKADGTIQAQARDTQGMVRGTPSDATQITVR
jgi:hypothetical protein